MGFEPTSILLKILGVRHGFASICVQLQTVRETVHRFFREADVGVSHSCAGIRMTELLLRDLYTVAEIVQHGSNGMTECVEPAT